MKMLRLVAVIAFLVNAMADGWVVSNHLSENVRSVPHFSGETDMILSRPTDGSVAGRNRGELAGGELLPQTLPIGPGKLRDFIVSDKAGHGLHNYFVRFGFQPEGSSSWVEFGVVSAGYGFPNWSSAREKIREGVERAIVIARQSGRTPDSNGVWAILRVWYWCDNPPPVSELPSIIGLSMVNPVESDLASVDSDTVIGVFEPGQPAGIEQAIVTVPGLDYVRIDMLNSVAQAQSLEWSSDRGISLSDNWPPDRPKLTAVNYLFIDASLASGKFPIVFTLGKGQERIFFWERGEPLIGPLLSISRRETGVDVTIRSTTSVVDVLTSTNNVTWSTFHRFTDVAGVVRGVITNAPANLFFKAVSY